MPFYDYFLIITALIPSVALCIYVYKKDRVEKEPILLLLTLLLFGVLIIPAILYVGEVIEIAVDYIFGLFGIVYKGHFYSFSPAVGKYVISSYGEPIYQFFQAFFVVALVEEGFKYIALRLGTLKNENFNCFFDGLIYAVFVSLGFASFENVLYVLDYGVTTVVTRAFLSVPGHMFFGVFMGYYYSLYMVNKKAERIESDLQEQGMLFEISSQKRSHGNGVKALLVPVVMHGLYDFCLFYYTPVTLLIFVGVVIFMYIHCFKKISNISKIDAQHFTILYSLMYQRYPHLKTLSEQQQEDVAEIIADPDIDE